MLKFTFFWAIWFSINAAYAGYLFSLNYSNAWIHAGIALLSLLMFIKNMIMFHIKK